MLKWVHIIILLPTTVFTQPTDPDATTQTSNLFYNLKSLAKGNLLFGHQDALAYGLDSNGHRWINESERSDVKSVTGSHPAVYGWDIGGIEINNNTLNIDNILFDNMKEWIKQGHSRGGIITISWHANNPQTGGNTWDVSGRAVNHIIPGGDKHEEYKKWLDRIANFANDLIDKQGNYIPVLFRPFHEHTGDWFWWGRTSCTPQEYITLWQFTVQYLKNIKRIHHFLYAYSPSNQGVNNTSTYLERYPGDTYVDVLGTDDYTNVFHRIQLFSFLNNIQIVVNLANQKEKIAALTETGYERIPDIHWFTQQIVEPIKRDSVARQIAYFLVWRNGRPDHFYAPYPGHAAASDLVNIYNDPFVVFESQLDDLYATPSISILQPLPDLIVDLQSTISLNLDNYFSKATSYQITYFPEKSFAEIVINGRNQLNITTTEKSGKGIYRVRASSDTQHRELMFLLSVGDSLFSKSTMISKSIIYPNPSKDFLYIKSKEVITHFQIIEISGKILKSSRLDEKIDISTLPSGVYILALINENVTFYKRFKKIN